MAMDFLNYPWKHGAKPTAHVRLAQGDFVILETFDGKAKYAVSVQSSGEIHFDKLDEDGK